MSDHLELLDWRRRVTALYAEVRALLEGDPEAAHRRWRAGRDELLARHPQSPLEAPARSTFTGLRCFDYNPELVYAVPVDTDVAPERYDVGMSGGQTMAFERFGTITLPIGRLDVFWLASYGGGVFLPFRDSTAGDETYGGGRYLLDTVKGADLGSTQDGELVLDFNFAYHPSCHYSPAWSCPLAPPGNRLEARVTAGELAFD